MKIKIEESVQKFVRGLEKPTISKFTKLTDLLEKFGSQLPMPYSKKISNRLFELRIRGQQEVRIFYTFHQDQAVLFHGFVKKTQRTPQREIETATNKLKSLTTV
ncbi:MAG: type II toxin-antitoxin system RelE/ParE family toxin [Candidatus Levybacteria bacterium]|nr:type II toxin-antitoxin system RelE/ParE family toxin [Candidatus Levybacteria bacterium]